MSLIINWLLLCLFFNKHSGKMVTSQSRIDKMEFNADGSITQVSPTHKGIEDVTLK